MNRKEAKIFVDFLEDRIKKNLDKRIKDPNKNKIEKVETPNGIKIKITNAVWKKDFTTAVGYDIYKAKVEYTEDNWDTYMMERLVRLTKLDFKRQHADKYEIK